MMIDRERLKNMLNEYGFSDFLNVEQVLKFDEIKKYRFEEYGQRIIIFYCDNTTVDLRVTRP